MKARADFMRVTNFEHHDATSRSSSIGANCSSRIKTGSRATVNIYARITSMSRRVVNVFEDVVSIEVPTAAAGEAVKG